MKRILITGKDSYIGTSVEAWLMRDPGAYLVDTVDMRDGSWRTLDFSTYDVVFHVAGIAHVSGKSKLKDLYFVVNRDLAIETAMKAKNEGVKQFIFMSSILVYGEGIGFIDGDTVPAPSNYYGESKLQAENGLRLLETKDFRIAIIRPPMIYGKGSKGNYPRLAEASKFLPIFPNIQNKRSMLYIGNLCGLIEKIVEHEANGIFYPQNREYVSTSDMVKEIAGIHGRPICLVSFFNPFIHMARPRVSTLEKLFGDQYFDLELSKVDWDYQLYELEESLQLTEKDNR